MRLTSLIVAVHQVISFEVRPPLQLARFKLWSSWVVLQVCYSTVGYCWLQNHLIEALYGCELWCDDVAVASTAQADPDKIVPRGLQLTWQTRCAPTGVVCLQSAKDVCVNDNMMTMSIKIRHSLSTPQSVCCPSGYV